MSTPILMPQMGESIAEGTIVRWIKKVGDPVERDEPLFEISTDKVDAEIPSPAAGVLAEITAQEGETVPVNTVVGTIRPAGEAAAAESSPTATDGRTVAVAAAPAEEGGEPPGGAVTPAAAPALPGAAGGGAGDARARSSPLVRRIAREHDVDIGRLRGSGIAGRVTKRDILEHIERRTVEPAAAGHGGAARAGRVQPAPGDEVQPLSIMRRKIAEHMILSRRTSAHVHTVFHVNFSTVERIRQQKKADYERAGARLTYMAFIAKAVIDALRRHPIVNASLDGDRIIYRKAINLGIAVALDTGLLVPVIKHADERNMLGLSRAIADLAERARGKQLQPEDVQGGTFTITNPGQFGSQFGMPIINQPQVAILGVGAIEKRPIVENDAIAIRTMAYLTLGFDHRLIDGAVADQFMADIRQQIEHFDPSQV